MNRGIAWEEPFERLMKVLLDGQATDEDRDELEALLLENAEARKAYRELLEVDAMLKCRSVPLGQAHGEAEASRPLPVQGRWSVYLIRAAAIVLCGVGLWWLWRAPGKSPPARSTPYAILARTSSVEWGDSPEVTEGDVLDHKWVVLEAGIVQVLFCCGVRSTVRGPARLRVDSATQCTLQHGTMTAFSTAHEDIAFEVRTPVARIVDVGTEFAVAVGEKGETELHVVEGEVHVTPLADDDSTTALTEGSACVVTTDARVTAIAFDGERFADIRCGALQKSTLAHLQFDCGTDTSAYVGTESPAHAAGDMLPHERTWNLLIGDHSGRFLAADGSLFPHDLSIDFGVGNLEEIDWNAEVRSIVSVSVGVFGTALGRDDIRCPQKTGDCLGLRLAGLPPGKYRLHLVARSSAVRPSWGNFLALKRHEAWIGINGYEDAPYYVMEPLSDETAANWRDGQTHVSHGFSITEPNDVLYIRTRHDRHNSPRKSGSNALIQGFQIVQLQ